MHVRLYILGMLLFPLIATADIYKWKDKDGVVRYSDTPRLPM